MEKTIATNINYQEELKQVIDKQIALIKEDASTDKLAENTIRFNELSQQIIDDKDINPVKRAIMLATISVYTNIFIDSLKRNKQAEKKLERLKNFESKKNKEFKKESTKVKPVIYSDSQFRIGPKKR